MPTIQEMEEALRRRGKDPRAEFEKFWNRGTPARLAFREGAGDTGRDERSSVLSRAWGGVKEAADTFSRHTPLGMGIDYGVGQYYKLGHDRRMAQPITEEEIQAGITRRRVGLQRAQAPGAEEIGREREPAPMPRPEPAPRPGPAPFAYPANYPSHLRKLEQTYGFRQGSLIDIQREGLFAAQGERASIRRPERGAGVPIEISARGPEVSPEEREERWEKSWGPESPVGERRAARTERFEEGRTRGRADLAQRQEQLKLMQMDPLERAVYGMQKRNRATAKRAREERETAHQRELELERVRHPQKAQPAPSIRTTATEIIGIDPQTGKVQWTIPKGGLSPDDIRDIGIAQRILQAETGRSLIDAPKHTEEELTWAHGILDKYIQQRTGTQDASEYGTEAELKRAYEEAWDAGDTERADWLWLQVIRRGYAKNE